jgi:hypothetical protein
MPIRELAAERLVPFRRWPKPVIEVREADHQELSMFGEIEEQARQRHRIRSPGYTDEDARAGRQQRVAADRTANLLV